MSDELRAPLVRALEAFVADLTIEKFGDPHLGFLVLLHPDRHPAIVAFSPQGADELASVTITDSTEEQEPDATYMRSFFQYSDFAVAAEALDDAKTAWKYPYKAPTERFGAYLDRKVAERWADRRDRAVTTELEKAAYEEAHKAQCPNCSRRFTERGLKQHQARSPFDGCRTATDAPGPKPPPPIRVRCPLCWKWCGPSDEMPEHMETDHAGKFVIG